ncbi:UNVERIFIED_CONTAM: hypothetical protein Sradi_1913700 [Sesamum radiatum]|uniref:Uncharacterized protein n=1 Tax=Sesamum radiatum TaxID=300843 RepID=A0AAW2TZ35_SESRA
MEKLEDLKTRLDNDTYIDMILQSIPPSYDPFIINYNMTGLEKFICDLINMLVQYKTMTHKSALTILVEAASTTKAKYKQVGRCKRTKGKGKVIAVTASVEGSPAAPKGIRLEVLTGHRQMMYACINERGIERGCAHNSSQAQVLERSRRLSKDEMILRLGDGKVVATEANMTVQCK